MEFGDLAILCPQARTLPKIGGAYVCPEGTQGDYVEIIRFADLQSRPEFAVLASENRSITTLDLLAYYIQDLERRACFTDFTILENTD